MESSVFLIRKPPSVQRSPDASPPRSTCLLRTDTHTDKQIEADRQGDGRTHSPSSPFTASCCSGASRALTEGWDRVSGTEPEKAKQVKERGNKGTEGAETGSREWEGPHMCYTGRRKGGGGQKGNMMKKKDGQNILVVKTFRHMSQRQPQSTTKIIPPFQQTHQLKGFTKFLRDWSTRGSLPKTGCNPLRTQAAAIKTCVTLESNIFWLESMSNQSWFNQRQQTQTVTDLNIMKHTMTAS